MIKYTAVKFILGSAIVLAFFYVGFATMAESFLLELLRNSVANNTANAADAPQITGVSPNNVLVGSSSVSIVITGNNFYSVYARLNLPAVLRTVSAVLIYRGNPPLTISTDTSATFLATYIDSNHLSATVPAAFLAQPGDVSIVVVNLSGFPLNPDVAPSNIFDLRVAAANPQPTINGVNGNPPGLMPSTTGLASSISLIVNGTAFVNGSVIGINNLTDSSVISATTYSSPTQLRATIGSPYASRIGTYWITVRNPGPGGGLSNMVSLTIVNPVPIISTLFFADAVASNNQPFQHVSCCSKSLSSRAVE